MTINDLSISQKKALVGQILNKEQTGNDWSQITEMFNLQIHPDTLRKAALGVRLATDAMSVDDKSDSYIERQKLRDLNAKVNAEYRKESRSELLRQTVRESVRNLVPLCSQEHRDVSSFHEDKDRELVVCIGDTHFGADINCRGLRGETLNIYNEKVFTDRMNTLLDRIVEIVEKEKISVVRVFLVGDLIDGILRQSQLTRLEYGLIDQVIRFSEIMADWFYRLSSHIYYLYVTGVSGNHSEIRPLNSKAREFEEQNLEKIIFWYLNARLIGCTNVSVNDVCDRMQLVDVMGYNFLLLHGDGQKSIDEIARQSVNLYGNKIDFFVCGHLHKLNEYPAGYTSDGNSEIIRVPSVCGMDSYAQSKGYGGRAGAIALVIQEGYGCMCKYPIRLD